MPASINGHETSVAGISNKWGWFVALGLVLITSGLIAWLVVGTVIHGGIILIAASPLVGGGFQIINAFLAKQWDGFAVGLSCGLLYLIGGLSIMNEPTQGALALTILAGASLVVSGIVRMLFALEHRNMSAWSIILLSGIVSIAVGCLLYLTLPWSGLWILGTLLAGERSVQGVSWLCFGLSLWGAHKK